MIKSSHLLHISLWVGHHGDDIEQGVWITLPVTRKEFDDTLASIGIVEGDMICWLYSTNILGLQAMDLTRYTLAQINHFAARLAMMGEEEITTFSAIMESDRAFDSLEKFIDYTYTADSYTLLPDVKCAADLGRNYLQSKTFPEEYQALKAFVDPQEIGMLVAQMAASGTTDVDASPSTKKRMQNGQFTPLGYLTSRNNWNTNPKEWEIPAALYLCGLWPIEDEM